MKREELMKELGISRRTFYRYLKSGIIYTDPDRGYDVYSKGMSKVKGRRYYNLTDACKKLKCDKQYVKSHLQILTHSLLYDVGRYLSEDAYVEINELSKDGERHKVDLWYEGGVWHIY